MNETTQPTNSQVDLVSAALVECQGKLKSANMDATNPFFKSKYATLGAVIEASREPLYNAGLAIQQTPRISGALVSVQTTIRHKSGQSLDGGTMELPIGENERNSDAQLAGSILTYLKRYAWASVLGIYADEDSDGNDAPKGSIKRQAPEPSQHTTPPTKALPIATPARRSYVLNALKAGEGGNARKAWTDYVEAQGWITPQQLIEDWPLDKVPVNGDGLLELIKRFDEFCNAKRGEV